MSFLSRMGSAGPVNGDFAASLVSGNPLGGSFSFALGGMPRRGPLAASTLHRPIVAIFDNMPCIA